MKVLHVIQALAPRYGGPSTTIWPMVAALNRLPGVLAEIAATDADGPGGRFDSSAVRNDVPVYLFRRDLSEQWKYSRGLARWLRQNVHRYNVVHIHGIWTHPNLVAARSSFVADVPFVVRPAGMLSDYCLASKGLKKRLYWALFEGKSIRQAAGFHCTGEEEVADVKAVRQDARTFLIPQAIDVDAFAAPSDKGRLRDLCGLTGADRPIILFLGRLHPVKGIADLLLPAFARLKREAFLAIAGGADSQAPGYEATIRQTVERLGIGDRVALLGAIRPGDRWQLFDGATIFVLPSHSENFGMVVAEAMARGCPVVVTEGVQAKAQVKFADAGVVVSFDVGALAEALDNMLADPVAAAAAGASGRRYVQSELTWDRVALQLLDMYHAVVHPLTTGNS